MKLSDNFELFHKKIRLDKTRSDRIVSAHNNLRKRIFEDDFFSEIIEEIFLQGSYRTSTAIKPISEKEFDVDVVFSANFVNDMGILPNPEDVINLVYNSIKELPDYK